MNLLEAMGLESALHTASQSMIIPTVVLLLVFLAYTLYTIGSLIVELYVERRHYKACIPKLIAALEAAPDQPEALDRVIDNAGLLDTQTHILKELVSYSALPEDAQVEIAKQLLSDEKERYEKALAWTEIATKAAPMLGLMGTLIPLGPGIVALGGGDLDTLSSSLLMAFDTTVAGLFVAVVCMFVSRVRRRWYSKYLIGLEGAMNTILEKSDVSQDDEEEQELIEDVA